MIKISPLLVLIAVNPMYCCIRNKEFSYCNTALCFQDEDFAHSWSKYEGELDMNSSKKLFFDISPGKKVIFNRAICDEGAQSADEASCRRLTASQVERLKRAVHLYTGMVHMKQTADDLKRQAGDPEIIGVCGNKILNPVYAEKMKLYNTLHNLITIDDTYAAFQLVKLMRNE